MDIKDFLYDRLPELYRKYDAEQASPYPLKRYLDILTEGGLAELLKYIEDLRKIQNIDECPKEFLPLIAQQYGLDFPYDMDETSQRKFIKVLPKLYANKGTEEAFKYLAREIFGEATNLKANMAQKPEEMADEEWQKLNDWQKLLVYLEIDGETLKLENKHINFLKFCEIIRPVNTVVIPYLALFYKDQYERLNRANDIDSHDFITERNADKVTNKTQDSYDLIKFIESWKDVYSKSPRTSNRLNHSLLTNNFTLNTVGITDVHIDTLKEFAGEDIRRKFITDYHVDVFKDENSFDARKKKLDNDVSFKVQEVSLEQRAKEILDAIDSIFTQELSYDTRTQKTKEGKCLEKPHVLDNEEYIKEMDDSKDSLKVSKQYDDVYKNSFYTRLNVKGELTKSALTNASGLTDYNLDVTKDVNIDYLRPTKEGQGIDKPIDTSVDQYNKSKVRVSSVGTFTRTRTATLLNRTGLVLNATFRTNDGNLRVVNMDY